MFEAALLGLDNLFDPYVLLAAFVGVCIGTFTAVAPQGLGTPLMYSILLPVVIRWKPLTGIALLIGMSSVSAICAAYLPILFGIPGGAGSQATILDGYPMGRRGEARRALGASFMAGGMGSLIGTFTLALAIPVATPLIQLLGSPELFVVALWGLSMVALLAGRRPLKGLIAAALGLLISAVGQQEQSGIMRFVFDQPYLLDGFTLSVIALALFGVPSALDLALSRMGIEQQAAPLRGSLLDGVRDALREWWLVVRCSFVGIWVGIVPGIGSQTVDWLAYGHAAHTCKGGSESFGKGDVRGVIAPESANDAKDGGDLITTLFLGLPQGTTTALFIVALLAMGFVPGPQLVQKNADLIFSVVWIQGLSGIVGTLIGFALANQLAKLADVRYSIMVPLILTFVLMGAYSAHLDPVDLLAVVGFGALGYLMKRFGYPRPPLILGLVLGGLLERYLYRAMASYGFSWLAWPSVLVLLALVAVSLIYAIRANLRHSTQAATAQATVTAKQPRLHPRTILTAFFTFLFAGAIVLGWDWPYIAKLMPVYLVAIPALLFCLIQLIRDFRGAEPEADGAEMDETFETRLDSRTEMNRTLAFFAWFVAAAAGVWLLGIVIALPLAVFLYARAEGGEKWLTATALAGVVYLMLWGIFEYALEMRWPAGWLFF